MTGLLQGPEDFVHCKGKIGSWSQGSANHGPKTPDTSPNILIHAPKNGENKN
jgi:hypothetical protein